MVTAGTIACVYGIYFVLLYFKCAPDTRFTIFNMIRLKVVSALCQMVALFALQSPIFSNWFKGLANLLLTISMPLEANPACLKLTKWLKRQNLGFLAGWISFFSFWIFIFILLNAHRVPLIRRRSKPSAFVTLQKFASLLCSSAVVVITPIFIDFDEIGGNAERFGEEYRISHGFILSHLATS